MQKKNSVNQSCGYLGSDVTVQEVQEHYMDCSTEKKKKYNNIKLPEHGTRNSHFHVTYKSFIAALYIVVNCTFLIYLAVGQMSLFLT